MIHEQNNGYAVVIENPKLWGKYCVFTPKGLIIPCHNLNTARNIRDDYNMKVKKCQDTEKATITDKILLKVKQHKQA